MKNHSLSIHNQLQIISEEIRDCQKYQFSNAVFNNSERRLLKNINVSLLENRSLFHSDRFNISFVRLNQVLNLFKIVEWLYTSVALATFSGM